MFALPVSCAAFVTDVSAQGENYDVLDILTHEDETDTFSRNVGNKQTYAVQQPRRAKISHTLTRKPEISQVR
jgi:hypothetical protein